MKIERITPFLVDRCLIVRVYTDQGIVGTGEAGLWAHHGLVYNAVNELSGCLVGKSPERMEHHFQTATRLTHFTGPIVTAALSAIDIALWDILGQSVGKPIYGLLGGACRDKVKVFASIVGSSKGELVDRAIAAIEAGYTSLRTTPFLDGWERRTPSRYISEAIEIIAAIREAIGYEIDFGVEMHRNLTPDEAVIVGIAIEPLRLLYFEDPVPPESLQALRYVSERVRIPLAFGERCYSLFQFKELLNTGTVAMIRPDISLAGGFTQGKKIAACAEASFVNIFPHLMGSPVNVAAFAHFAASIPNYAVMESGSTHLNDIVDMPMLIEGGHVQPSDRPGLGLNLREEVLSKFPRSTYQVSPGIRSDGSIAH